MASNPNAVVTDLREDRESIQAWLDAMPLAVALFGEDERLAFANRRYAELAGLSRRSIPPTLHDAWPNALADLEPEISAARRSGAPVTRVIEYRVGAETRTAEVTIVRLSSPSGGWAFSGLDVTERESLRRSLARSVHELEAIFATIPEAVRVFEPGGAIVRLNAGAQAAHPSPPPASVSALWQADRPKGPDGDVLFLHEHPAARALAGESVRGQHLTVRRDGSAADLEVNAEPLRDEQGALWGAVTVDRDVSAASHERDRRLAAIGQLGAGVLHDVNNILNPILAAAYLIESYGAADPAIQDYARRIAHAAEMGVARLARLRRFIRQDPIDEKSEPVDLGKLAEEVIAIATPLWESRDGSTAINVERDLAPGAIVRGSAAELRAAVLNLVQNALDAMPRGGTIAISTSVADGAVVLEVRDTGPGMPAEVRDRAFEPFFTTKGDRGTGLGLAEVYGIVRRHRGVTEIDSAPGAGTAVRLRLPLAHVTT